MVMAGMTHGIITALMLIVVGVTHTTATRASIRRGDITLIIAPGDMIITLMAGEEILIIAM